VQWMILSHVSDQERIEVALCDARMARMLFELCWTARHTDFIFHNARQQQFADDVFVKFCRHSAVALMIPARALSTNSSKKVIEICVHRDASY
jgi:hypothetical protein